MDAVHQLLVAAINQVIPADSVVKEGIAGKDNAIPDEADTIRGMTRRVQHFEVKVAYVNAIAIFEETVGIG